MKYWKLLNPDGTINSVESHSNDHVVPGAVEITQQEYDAYIASLPVIEPEPVITYSTHLGQVLEINPSSTKPVKVKVHHEKEDVWEEYDCFVTEAVKDQFTQGDIAVDSWVLVTFFENDVLKPICTGAVYPSWQ